MRQAMTQHTTPALQAVGGRILLCASTADQRRGLGGIFFDDLNDRPQDEVALALLW